MSKKKINNYEVFKCTNDIDKDYRNWLEEKDLDNIKADELEQLQEEMAIFKEIWKENYIMYWNDEYGIECVKNINLIPKK